MFVKGLIAAAILFANTLPAMDLSVCVRNGLKLDTDTMAVFRSEFGKTVAASGYRLAFVPCDQAEIQVLLGHPAVSTPGDALGAAATQDGKVMPWLEVYPNAVARMVDSRLPAILGASMARVATHELAHYLLQEPEHHDTGALRTRLTAGVLLAGGPAAFRIPRR